MMRTIKRLTPVFLLFLLLATIMPAHAQSPAAMPHAHAKLIASVTGTKNAATVFLGVDIALDDGWKTYWRTPGDAGLAPVFDWTGSENLKAPRVFYPAPTRFTISGFDNFGYTGHVTFPVMVPLERKGDAVKARLKLSILACHEICVPESFDLSLDLPADKSGPSPEASLLADSFQKVPVTVMPSGFLPGMYLWLDPQGTKLSLDVTTNRKPSELDVFVENEDQHVFGKPEYAFTPTAGLLNIEIPLNEKVSSPETLLASLNKKPVVVTVVTEAEKIELPMSVLPLSSKAASTEAPQPPPPEHLLSLSILLVAFLGGLILNLMPCVLPVLSLKVLSALHLGAKEKTEARRGFLAGALGIMASFWLLAAILALLKAAGSSVGWGIQFQHPAFLVFLILVTLLFSINLAGFFEIPLPRFVADRLGGADHRHPTLTGHFLTGMFATLLATPCTAPFLGTAVGFALTSGSLQIAAVFTAMGLGLALPWLLFAAWPGFAGLLPRPGRWMITLKRVLAAALFITAVWLGVVLYGVLAPVHEKTPPVGWTAFDEALIGQEAAKGRLVFVDVTADWCLTCKANKKFVLESAAVRQELDRRHALLIQGDWTKQDETIRRYLEKHGRFGIPFNVVYGPNAKDGIVLPELLTEKSVLEALKLAADQ